MDARTVFILVFCIGCFPGAVANYCSGNNQVASVCQSSSASGNVVSLDTRQVPTGSEVECTCSVNMGGGTINYIDYSGPGGNVGSCGIEFRYGHKILSCPTTYDFNTDSLTTITFRQTTANSAPQACMTIWLDSTTDSMTVTCLQHTLTTTTTQSTQTTSATATSTISSTPFTSSTFSPTSTSATTTTTTTTKPTTTTTKTTTTPATTTTTQATTTTKPTTQTTTTTTTTKPTTTTTQSTAQTTTTKATTTTTKTTTKPTTTTPTTPTPTTPTSTTTPDVTTQTTTPTTTTAASTTVSQSSSTRSTVATDTSSFTGSFSSSTMSGTSYGSSTGAMPSEKQQDDSDAIMIGILVGGLVGMLIVTAILIVCFSRRKRRMRQMKRTPLPEQPKASPERRQFSSSFSDDIILTENNLYGMDDGDGPKGPNGFGNNGNITTDKQALYSPDTGGEDGTQLGLAVDNAAYQSNVPDEAKAMATGAPEAVSADGSADVRVVVDKIDDPGTVPIDATGNPEASDTYARVLF